MSDTRRFYFSFLLKVLLYLGLLMASLPFLASLMNQTDPDSNPSNQAAFTFDVSQLQPGGVQAIEWPGGTAWVYYRTLEDITHLERSEDRKRQSVESDKVILTTGQSLDAIFRSQRKQYFVFIPFENKRHCQVRLEILIDGHNGFGEACYGARYTTAGKIIKGTGHAQQTHLRIPAYEWLGDQQIRIVQPTK